MTEALGVWLASAWVACAVKGGGVGMSGPGGQYGAQAAERYRSAGVVVARAFAEVPTFLQLLGDITGTQVLDLACGTGFYTRMALDAGASRVVGVDVSADMLAQARAETQDDQHAVDFTNSTWPPCRHWANSTWSSGAFCSTTRQTAIDWP